jgi:cytochrome c peroxidase
MRRALVLVALLGAPAAAEPPPWEERVLSAPTDFEAARALDPAALIAHGRRLFVGKFTAADGAGRPLATQADLPTARRAAARAFQRLSGPDAAACAGCHNDPLPGGAGDFAANAFTSEGLRNAEFDILDPQFSSERNTSHLFGAGLLELLAREMTAALHGQRDAALAQARASGAPATVALSAKGVDFGRLTALPDGLIDHAGVKGVDPDLVVRPFSRKGVVGSLRRFTVNAMNAHHGMQAVERYGARWTGSPDHDGDGVGVELGEGDVSAVVAFQAALPPPTDAPPDDPEWARRAAEGRAAFAALGCAACHAPALPLDSLIFTDPSPYEGAGTLRAGDVAQPIAIDLGALPWAAALERDAQGRWLVPVYGDLRRHVIVDAQVAGFADETLSQGFVAPDAFKTAELWGAGDSAPYGHRGDLTTLDDAIRAHGGEARAARDAYVAADEDLRAAVIAFLKALRAPE